MRLLILLAVFALSACDDRTTSDKCNQYRAEFLALSACAEAADCRLTDKMWYRKRHVGVLAVQWCNTAEPNGGVMDKEVPTPDEEDLSASN